MATFDRFRRPLRCAASVVIGISLGFATGCEPRDGAQRTAGPARIVVSVPPLEGLVEALAPEGSEVGVLIPAGRSPHTFEPSPGDLAALARADLVVTIGLGMEGSFPARALADRERVEMAGVLGIGAEEGHAAHDHDGHDHAHGGTDPHLWLDPVLVERFVPVLGERLGALVPPSGDARARAAEASAMLLERVRAVDASYRDRLAPFAGAGVITQHAAWSRLAERYGLVILGVIQEAEGVEPPPGHVRALLDAAREHRVRAILTEPQLDGAVARRMGEGLGVPVGTLDPLGSGDWEAMMLANLDELVRVLGSGEGPDE